jgi:hypothetical protein
MQGGLKHATLIKGQVNVLGPMKSRAEIIEDKPCTS